MLGSIYIGLSGLTAYSEGLKTVSNNVSNLNTSGFKASDVTFADVYGAGSTGGLEYGASGNTGGHGVSLDQTIINFEQGELRQTSRDLDLAIDGGGFFVLLDGDQTYYTRTGSFAVDDDGFLVLAGTDYKLAALDSSGRLTTLNIDQDRTSEPVETTKIVFDDNLSLTATEHTIPAVTVYDSRGTAHVWTLEFTREETAFDTWTLKVKNAAGEIGTKTLKTLNGSVHDDTKVLTFEDSVNGLSIAFDFTAISSYSTGAGSSLRAADVDGNGTGTITTVAVNAKGELEIAYSNEEKKSLGPIALADFRDPQALQQRSGGLFVDNGFAQVQYLPAEDSRVGTILSRRLEASNVDLGSQFAELILIQRGFQASSQIISVSNDMIQQLFGIRGQG